jgi:hypothetical protein
MEYGISMLHWILMERKETTVEIDESKIDDMVLALLHLTTFKEYGALRAWKSHDWDAMDRLFSKGLISDPKSKAKSVVLSEEGAKRSQELFQKYFFKARDS